MKEDIRKWITEHPCDYQMIRGEAPMTELEHKYILLELKKQGYDELIRMINDQSS